MSLSSKMDATYPKNSRYGQGVYRRRLRFCERDDWTVGILNDDYHAMWVRLKHNDLVIHSVESGMMRWPKTTCPGALKIMDEIVGCPLTVSRRDFYGDGRAGRNCTHLFDLAFWLIGHIRRASGNTVVDIEIPDRDHGSTSLSAAVDGVQIHKWLVQNDVIQDPLALSGVGLFAGFAAKVESLLSGLELDTARMLQKSAFVAQGRAFLVDSPVRIKAVDEPARRGACYAFSPELQSTTEGNIGYTRDFTDGLQEILPWDELEHKANRQSQGGTF